LFHVLIFSILILFYLHFIFYAFIFFSFFFFKEIIVFLICFIMKIIFKNFCIF
jgi:hypothetical protein